MRWYILVLGFILGACAATSVQQPKPTPNTIAEFQRYNDSVAIYVPGERAIVPLDSLRQALINQGI